MRWHLHNAYLIPALGNRMQRNGSGVQHGRCARPSHGMMTGHHDHADTKKHGLRVVTNKHKLLQLCVIVLS
jgi:hypothetical protein